MVNLRVAREDELELCMGFIAEAREHQREQGFVQWEDNFPSREMISEDIAAGRGYLVLDDASPIGYLCIDPCGDKVYERIEGAWQTDGEYLAIHRVALGAVGRGKGASRAMFGFAKSLCAQMGFCALRIDTYEKNEKMQHILLREGFALCGTVFPRGNPRLAFEWVREDR